MAAKFQHSSGVCTTMVIVAAIAMISTLLFAAAAAAAAGDYLLLLPLRILFYLLDFLPEMHGQLFCRERGGDGHNTTPGCCR
jgi:hypothetical protein